jgi:hypothetical protein
MVKRPDVSEEPENSVRKLSLKPAKERDVAYAQNSRIHVHNQRALDSTLVNLLHRSEFNLQRSFHVQND